MFNTKPDRVNICIVCGTNSDRVRNIESKVNAEIGLKDLLNKFGGLSVESGILCRNCFQKLINLDRKCRDFYDLCQENNASVCSTGKRLLQMKIQTKSRERFGVIALQKLWHILKFG